MPGKTPLTNTFKHVSFKMHINIICPLRHINSVLRYCIGAVCIVFGSLTPNASALDIHTERWPVSPTSYYQWWATDPSLSTPQDVIGGSQYIATLTISPVDYGTHVCPSGGYSCSPYQVGQVSNGYTSGYTLVSDPNATVQTVWNLVSPTLSGGPGAGKYALIYERDITSQMYVCASLARGGYPVFLTCQPYSINPVSCEATIPNATIDFLTFNASELNPGRKQSTQVNIQCTGGGSTVSISSNEYDANGKKVIRTDDGDDLYAIISANVDGGEKPVTPAGQSLTLLEGSNPLTLWAEVRANQPQKHEGAFTNTSVITLTYP